MTELRRLMKNRFAVRTVSAAFCLLIIATITGLLSIQGKPDRLFRFRDNSTEILRERDAIRGWAEFDKDSYLIGEPAGYRIRLLWHSNQIIPDIDTFKNGISFFPFNRREITEQQRVLEGDINEYILEFGLQAIDVETARSYELAPPTVYFKKAGDTGELLSYRIDAPQVHIGEYYPPNVAKIRMLGLKGEMDDPVALRQGIMALLGTLFILFSASMLWNFGRVRRSEILSEPERLWRKFQELKKTSLDSRTYMVQSELIFTDLLMSRIDMGPVAFWSGDDPDDAGWRATVHKARDIFYRAYLPDVPGPEAVTEINDLLDGLFSGIVEEDRLKTEEVSSLAVRLSRQPAMLAVCTTFTLVSVMLFLMAVYPQAWSSSDIVEYNRTVRNLAGDDSVERKYEQISGLAEKVDDEKIKSAALYNAGTFSTTPELTGIDIFQQDALLVVMFQEQRVFLDALLHSLAMEDPFLLVAIIRDSVRFMTQGEAALKAAIRLTPGDEMVRRNLELIQKRRNAYAETIQELLQEGEDAEGMSELQRQTLMDLEQFMQMEMPEEFAELEEGKDDKDYFILEGF